MDTTQVATDPPADKDPVCKYELELNVISSMQVCKYAGVQVCKYASMHVCNYESEPNVIITRTLWEQVTPWESGRKHIKDDWDNCGWKNCQMLSH